MCEDYWEWELARRRKLLALEDPQHEESDEDLIKGLPETVLPPPTLPKEKKRARPMLGR